MVSPEPISIIRNRIGERIAEMEGRIGRLRPRDIAAQMEAIRAMAAAHGLAALEGLADYGAHHAMMPGHREATRCCLGLMGTALASESAADRESLLASVALRIH